MVGLAAPGFGNVPLAERDDYEISRYVARSWPPRSR